MSTRLYDAGALALAVYARSRFRVRALGAPFRPPPGSLVVSSHRSDADVPLIVAALYCALHGLWRRDARLHFAVRDDLFLPGFFAGYPPDMSRLLRRAAYAVDVGPVLRSRLPCHPIRSATRLRLAEYLREHRDAELDVLLPPALARPIHERAAELRRSPRLARDVLSGDYADLLWAVVEPDELDGPDADATWARRLSAATDDLRELVRVLRGGDSLLIFPEGRPSPDGAFGPVLGGIGALVRRAGPRAVVPIAPTYDPLVEGRVHGFVGVGAPVEPPIGRDAILELLRRTTPLTVGHSVAAAVADGADAHVRLEADLESARGEGRPYEPELDEEATRRARVETALRLVHRLDLDPLVLAHRSARA